MDYICEDGRVSKQGKRVLLSFKNKVKEELDTDVEKQLRKATKLAAAKRSASPPQETGTSNESRKRRRA